MVGRGPATLSMDEAIALAAAAPVGPAPREPLTDSAVLGTLTPRQLEVAVLVADRADEPSDRGAAGGHSSAPPPPTSSTS